MVNREKIYKKQRCTDKGNEEIERERDCYEFTDLDSVFVAGHAIKSFVTKLIKKHP